MCLGIPLKLVSINEDGSGVAELNGTSVTVELSLLPDCKPGDFVLVHAGYALEVLDEKEALETIGIFRDASLI